MENEKFVERFIEVCGSDQPAVISKKLEISYQAARNYLGGRLPDANILIKIAKNTPFSLNWLLTGEGERYIEKKPATDLDSIYIHMQKFVKPEFFAMFNEFLVNYQPDFKRTNTVLPKTVKFKTSRIMPEKEKDRESLRLPGKED